MKDMIWNEEFRPIQVKDIISPHTKTILSYLEKPENIPNFLFHSTVGGTGKSSMAKAIVNDLGCDVLVLNASADRGIDNIRNKVLHFVRTQSSNGLRKCVFMDEGEKLTKDSMDALKNMIEEYSINSFYIFTTNNISKINDPMQSRFGATYEFSQPDKNEIYKFLEMICTKKGLQYDEVGLQKLIELKYPSIRRCINYLQDLSARELSATEPNMKKDDEEFIKIWNMIKSRKFVEVKNYIFTNGIDCLNLNTWIFNNLFEEEFELKVLIKLTQLIGRNEKDMKLGADNKIVFVSTLPEIMANF